ncbi:MAG TPA: hypothetical protein VGE12_03525 [Noviherbaspirillum sp.]
MKRQAPAILAGDFAHNLQVVADRLILPVSALTTWCLIIAPVGLLPLLHGRVGQEG